MDRLRLRGTSGIAAALVAVTGALVAGCTDDGGRARADAAPAPTAHSTGPGGWAGPVRPRGGQIGGGVDPRDAEPGAIDILAVSSGAWERDSWALDLRARPPRASSLDPARTVIEYGVVVDAEQDGVPDCHIAINNDAPDGYRVTVTNLRSGHAEEQVGPPYGSPIDFVHPDEEGGSRTMRFSFLHAPRDCDLYVPASYYAYATLTQDGRVVAWDYAPDADWVEMP